MLHHHTSQLPFFLTRDVAYDLVTEQLCVVVASHKTPYVDDFGDTVWAYEINDGSTRFEWELLTVDEANGFTQH